MARLGYDRYGAQGGDWGAGVTSHLGPLDREHCVGIHLNLVVAIPTPESMADLTPAEQAAWRGSSRSSTPGPTATATPSTCSPATACSTT
jgi:hypothetical protein